MSEFVPGLEGVIAFETQIAEPDRDGGALRYRGVDIEDLVGRVSFGNVWGLLVDNEFNPGLPPAEPFPIPIHSGDVRVDVQSAIAMPAPAWGLHQLLDITDDTARENLAHVSVMALSFVAQAARAGWAYPWCRRLGSTRPRLSPSGSCCGGAVSQTLSTFRLLMPTSCQPPSTA